MLGFTGPSAAALAPRLLVLTGARCCRGRFLEVESWNAEHGIQVTDEVEEKLVEEMKAAHAVGDERRGKIKESFGQAARSLEGAQVPF